LNTYMGANNGQWPADVVQLKSYFNPPVEDDILQRWEIVPKTAFPGRDFAGDWVLTEKSPVDSEFDHLWTIDGPFSGGVGPYISLRKCRWNLRSKLVTIKIISQPTVFAFVSSSFGRAIGSF